MQLKLKTVFIVFLKATEKGIDNILKMMLRIEFMKIRLNSV